MQFRNLGRSGLRVSLIGVGCNNFGSRSDEAASRAVIHAALDSGITLFDTADTYGNRGRSEEILGAVLGPRRKDVVVATKFALDMDDAGHLKGASRRYIMSAVEASLKRLNTDWIDLYQQHRPDPLTPIEETLRALDDLIRQGKVRYIGCSNLPAWQVVEAQMTARQHGLNAFVACQDEYSLIVRDAEADLLPAMAQHGLSLLPYFPLASGLLTGKYKRGVEPAPGTRFAGTRSLRERYFTEANLAIAEKLEAFAQARGRTLLELAFAWLAACPQLGSIIAGATSAAQIAANVKAAEWTLGAEELAEIDQLREGMTAATKRRRQGIR